MTGEAVKIVWMSDLHFVEEGLVLGHDPRLRVAAAVDHVNAHHADTDLCVVSGDLVNRGRLAEYAALKNHLDRLVVPYEVMVGNHDSRAELRQVFKMPPGCMESFVQYVLPYPACRVICLDTLDPGSDAGQFCPARLEWLENTLAQGRPCVVFMHHPPLALGLPMQDPDRLVDGGSLLDVLSAHGAALHLFAGHVHRGTCGMVQGLPFATIPSVLYQAPPPRPAWDWNSFTPAAEAPMIGIIRAGDDVTLHYEQFCEVTYGL